MTTYWDPRTDQPNEISTYFHCARCLDELPDGQSPQSYARLEAGITADGSTQVRCIRHDLNVVILSKRPREGLVYVNGRDDPTEAP